MNIQGRYGVSCTITKAGPNRWKFNCHGSCRFGSNDNGLTFVDPSGGPFIGIGDTLKSINKNLPDEKIISIESDDENIYFITK